MSFVEEVTAGESLPGGTNDDLWLARTVQEALGERALDELVHLNTPPYFEGSVRSAPVCVSNCDTILTTSMSIYRGQQSAPYTRSIGKRGERT